MRRFAREHLVEHRAERVDVAARVELALTAGLLRTHILRRAEGESRLGQPVGRTLRHRERDAEIRHHRLALVQENVFGLHVAVNHPMAMGIIERARDLLRDVERDVERELLLAVQLLPQRLAADIGDDVEQKSARHARVDQREDVGMIEAGGDRDLTQESIGAERGGDLRSQHLEGDRPIVLQVMREIDGRHAAAPQLPLDAVSAREGVGHCGAVVAHGR